MNEMLKDLKVNEIKFTSTNTYFNDEIVKTQFDRSKDKKKIKIGYDKYESNSDK